MRLSIFAATILSVAAAPAWANSINFTGSTVTATLYDPNLSTVLGGPTVAVVGSGTTFPSGSIMGNTAFSIDITGNQILYSPLTTVTYGSGAFNGFVFTFSGAPTITGVTLDGSSTFTPDAISFTANSIDLNLSGNSVTATGLAALDVTFAAAQATPEPASWTLLLAPLLSISLLTRKRCNSQTATAA